MPRVRPSGAASQLDLFEQPASFSGACWRPVCGGTAPSAARSMWLARARPGLPDPLATP